MDPAPTPTTRDRLQRFGPPALVLVCALALICAVLKIASTSFDLHVFRTTDLAAYAHLAAHPFDAGFRQSIYAAPFFATSHLSLISFVFYPLTVFGHPVRVMLVLQTLSLFGSGVVVYLIARDALKSAWLGTAAACSYLLHPTLTYTALSDVHPEAFVPLFLLLAWRARRAEKLLPFLGWLVAAVLCKENLVLIMGCLAFILWREGQDRRWWLGTLGVAAAPVLLAGIIKAAVGYAGPVNPVLVYYGHIADSLPGVAIWLASHPIQAVQQLIRPHPWPVLVPVLGLTFLRPRWLLPCLPIVLQRGFAAPWLTPNWWEFHGAIQLPVFLYLGALEVLAERTLRHRRLLAVAMLLVSAGLWIGTHGSRVAAGVRLSANPALEARRAFLDRVPSEGTVLASRPDLAYLSTLSRLVDLDYAVLGRYPEAGPILVPFDPPSDVTSVVYDSTYCAEPLRSDPENRARLRATVQGMRLFAAQGELAILSAGSEGAPLFERGTALEQPLARGLHVRLTASGGPARAGQPLTVFAAWNRGDQVEAEGDVLVVLVDGRGEPRAHARRPLAWGLYGLRELPRANQAGLRVPLVLQLPADLPAGRYEVRALALEPWGKRPLPLSGASSVAVDVSAD